MDTAKFLELQYQTLRKEIEQANDRAFKLMLGGVTVVPAVQYIARTFELGVITLGLPFLVSIIALLFLAQNLTIMRCGRYIREHIEPYVQGIVGWETWLEGEDRENGHKLRLYDNIMVYSFYLLSLLFYCFSVYLAIRAGVDLFSRIGVGLMFSVYVVVGVGMTILICRHTRTSTRMPRPGRVADELPGQARPTPAAPDQASCDQ